MSRLGFRRTVNVVVASQKEQFRSEIAYLANFWSEILSAVTFLVIYTLFIDLLIKRTGLIAGYDRNDFFLLLFVTQLTYFSTTKLLALPMFHLVESIRFGHFDLMLLKPIPILTHLHARSIKPASTLFTAAPSLIFYGIMVNWSELSLTWSSVLLGALVWFAGLVIFRTYIFLLAYPVFTEGDATDSLSGFYWITSINQIPYFSLPKFMKFFSLTLIPTLLMTAGSVAVILNKGPVFDITGPALLASFVAVILYKFMWRRALSNYTSASS